MLSYCRMKSKPYSMYTTNSRDTNYMLRFKNMYHHICIKRDILVLITKEISVFFTILELYCKQSFMTTMMTNHDIVDVSHYRTNCNIYSKFINGIHKTLLVFLTSFYIIYYIIFIK